MSRKKKLKMPAGLQKPVTVTKKKSISLFQLFALIVLIAVFLMPVLSLVTTNRQSSSNSPITIQPQTTISQDEVQISPQTESVQQP
jgi:hypothetical protein